MADAPDNCPYCGGPVYVDRGDGGVGTINCVKGSSCLGSGLLVGFKLVDETTAIAAWNTRATPPAAVIDAMERALREISDLTKLSAGDFADKHPVLDAKLDAETMEHWHAVLSSRAAEALTDLKAWGAGK